MTWQKIFIFHPQGTKRMKTLITDLIDYSRLEERIEARKMCHQRSISIRNN